MFELVTRPRREELIPRDWLEEGAPYLEAAKFAQAIWIYHSLSIVAHCERARDLISSLNVYLCLHLSCNQGGPLAKRFGFFARRRAYQTAYERYVFRPSDRSSHFR